MARTLKKRDNLQERNNPCFKEQELSFKCFNENDYDKEKCQLEIHNYNMCKSFWNSVKAERRRNGIKPELPPLEERIEIRKQFFEKMHKLQSEK